MAKDSDTRFDAALAMAGLTPDAHDRAAALRIAHFLRECRARLMAMPDPDSKG